MMGGRIPAMEVGDSSVIYERFNKSPSLGNEEEQC